MDVEAAEAIAELGQRLDALEQSLRGEIGQLRNELRVEFREGLVENRRHADVQFEAVRDDIRLLADGFATVSADLAAHRQHSGSRFDALSADLAGHRQHSGSRFDALGADVAAHRVHADSRFDALGTDLATQRLHMDSRFDALSVEIRALIGSIAALSAKIDAKSS